MKAGGIEWTDDKVHDGKWRGAYQYRDVFLAREEGPFGLRWHVRADFPEHIGKPQSAWIEGCEFTTRREAIESLKVAVDFLRGLDIFMMALDSGLDRHSIENILRRWL